MTTQDHYFSPTPPGRSEPIVIPVEVRGLSLSLHSDVGVFSRQRADTGTLLIARTAELPASGEILDLGCGYGLLGVVAAVLSPGARVTLVDVNPRAADLASRNCQRYAPANTEVLTGDALEVLGEREFDTILCNPPYRAGKAVYMTLIEDAARRLRPGGTAWLVGRTRQGVKTMARDIGPWFSAVETAEVKSGYRVLACRAL
jgi:16S rRNA (guanine1207-N2)-methyltransferase